MRRRRKKKPGSKGNPKPQKNMTGIKMLRQAAKHKLGVNNRGGITSDYFRNKLIQENLARFANE